MSRGMRNASMIEECVGRNGTRSLPSAPEGLLPIRKGWMGMHTLVVDIGGTNVKLWRSGQTGKIKFPSGQDLTPERMLQGIKKNLGDWPYDRVSIGYPGQIVKGRPAAEPYNLGKGWVEFDYSGAFGRPIRMMNDACLQALGSYEGGKMLYLGLGTSVGTTFISDGKIVPLALGHLPFHNGKNFEDYLSREGRKTLPPRRWRRAVLAAAATLKAAFLADYVVLGGGGAKEMRKLPSGVRIGGNQNAFLGGLRLWDEHATLAPTAAE
jgi:polyphosphate glucokinase